MTTVLVTGVGAVTGYGVLRSLRQADPQLHLIGTDIHADAVGSAWSDCFEQVPFTASPEYLPRLERLIRAHRVDLIFPTIDPDLDLLAVEGAGLERLGCRLALNSQRMLRLGRDKWELDRALAAVGEPARIPSAIEGGFAELADAFGTPFLVKPRRGYGSRGVVRVHRENDFAPLAGRIGDELLAQPLIGSDDEEYTVGAFGDGRGSVCARISMRRRLAPDGSTARAWVDEPEPGLDQTVARLFAQLKPLGPTNLQLRRDGFDWKLLEINPRVSSSTSLRAAFGYNEAAMAVRLYQHGEFPEQPPLRRGYAVRYLEDQVVLEGDVG